MKFREITVKDIPELFIIRTMTRENTLTMDELAQRGITPKSIKVWLDCNRYYGR